MPKPSSSTAAAFLLVPALFLLPRAQQPAPAIVAAPSLQSQLQSRFGELHKAATFPGGTAGFVLADGSSFGIAVGVSDRTSGTPMKSSDRLLLGSVGKTYVMPGYQTELVYFPDLKISIAVQVNSSAPRSTGKALRAFAIDFANIIKSSAPPTLSTK